MNELSLDEIVEEFFYIIEYHEQDGDRDDLVTLIYLVHTMGYQRGFLDATRESNRIYVPNEADDKKT